MQPKMHHPGTARSSICRRRPVDGCSCSNEAMVRHDALDKRLPVVFRRFHPFQHRKDGEDEVLRILQIVLTSTYFFILFFGLSQVLCLSRSGLIFLSQMRRREKRPRQSRGRAASTIKLTAPILRNIYKSPLLG